MEGLVCLPNWQSVAVCMDQDQQNNAALNQREEKNPNGFAAIFTSCGVGFQGVVVLCHILFHGAPGQGGRAGCPEGVL